MTNIDMTSFSAVVSPEPCADGAGDLLGLVAGLALQHGPGHVRRDREGERGHRHEPGAGKHIDDRASNEGSRSLKLFNHNPRQVDVELDQVGWHMQ